MYGNIAVFEVPIPRAYAERIGQVMAAWSILELTVHQATYNFLDIGMKHGRVALREPSLDAYLSMLGTLMELEKIKPPPSFAELRYRIDILENERNLYAHGVWSPAKRPLVHVWHVRSTRGNWSAGEMKGTPRKVKPENLIRTPHFMQLIYNEIVTRQRHATALGAYLSPAPSP